MVPDPFNLQRFIDAQDGVYQTALSELRAGAKQSHWMWFIFPQLVGLGRSPAAKFFGLTSIEEARAYLDHWLLGPRLRECVDVLLLWSGKESAVEILGNIDSMKLRSSLTLFENLETDGPFSRALLNFFAAERDELTLALLHRSQ